MRFDQWANETNQQQLLDQDLFQKKLLYDIRDGVVFPAFRQRNICFYANGRKLFDFDGKKFKTHPAFAIAYENEPEDDYIDEQKLGTLDLCRNFCDGYEKIRGNTKLYLAPESAAISKFCKKYSCFKPDIESEIVVLDVELSLESQDTKGKQDRIDLVLYHKGQKQIRFFEVKLFGDDRLSSNKEKPAEVVGQIERYNSQLEARYDAENQRGELLDWYIQYVEILNSVFAKSLPTPESIDGKVDLLLWGADNSQWKSFSDTNQRIEELGSYVSWIKGVASVTDNTLTKKWWLRKRS